MGHLELTPKRHLSAFRRLALGSWRSGYDPTVYGTLSVRMERALEYLKAHEDATGARPGVLSLAALGCAAALRACPEANALLRFNRIYLREQVTLSVLVPGRQEGAESLRMVRLEEADRLSLEDIASRLATPVPPLLPAPPGLLARLPSALLAPVLRLLGFLAYTLNLDLSGLGVPKDPYGALMLTSLEGLGLESAFLPLLPLSRAPLCVAVGEVEELPVVEAGQVVLGKVLRVHASFDHRFIDGYHASVLARTLRQVLEDPFGQLGPPGAAGGP
jgi:hypothetical protein